MFSGQRIIFFKNVHETHGYPHEKEWNLALSHAITKLIQNGAKPKRNFEDKTEK